MKRKHIPAILLLGIWTFAGAAELQSLDTATLLRRYFGGENAVLEELGRESRSGEIHQYLRSRGSEENVKQLLSGLGAETYAVRKRSTEALIAQGAQILPAVRQYAAQHAGDPEIVFRCRSIQHALAGKEGRRYGEFEQRFLLMEKMKQVDADLREDARKEFQRILEEKPAELFELGREVERLTDFCRVYVRMGGDRDELMKWLIEAPVGQFMAAGMGVLQADFDEYLPQLLAKRGHRVIPVMDLLVGPFRDQPSGEQWELLMKEIAGTQYHHEPFIKELEKYQSLPGGFLSRLDLLFASDSEEMQLFCLYFVSGTGDLDLQRVTGLFKRMQTQKRHSGLAGKIKTMKPTAAQARLFLEVLTALDWREMLDAAGEGLGEAAGMEK